MRCHFVHAQLDLHSQILRGTEDDAAKIAAVRKHFLTAREYKVTAFSVPSTKNLSALFQARFNSRDIQSDQDAFQRLDDIYGELEMELIAPDFAVKLRVHFKSDT